MTLKTSNGIGGTNLNMLFLEDNPCLLLSQSRFSTRYYKKKAICNCRKFENFIDFVGYKVVFVEKICLPASMGIDSKKSRNEMNKFTFLSIIGLLTASSSVNAQTNFWNSPEAYLGQTPPGSTPVKFAPQLINDTPYFSMDRCAFSQDGKEFYYCRNNTWFSGKDASIQVYRYDGVRLVGWRFLVM
jgi:hypothetical protein